MTDDEVAALRAVLRDDVDRHKQLFAELDRGHAARAYTALISSAFVEAVWRRFGETHTEVRGTTSEMTDALNAAAAENQLRAALGQQVPPFADLETRTRAQMMLLIALTADYTENELDTLMADAHKVADNWLTFAPDK